MDFKNIEKSKLQYFSKLYKMWINFKFSDCVESLQNYKYNIRINPKYNEDIK